MDEPETKTCTNCKREIPAVNFMTHTVHCARNIKVCPVCKEPVPQAELQDHHEKMHKLLPCAKCGERVCGTDLEDHIRDSCAHTIKSCRYCELELPRRELPTHEGYCGVRTEQCADCQEWVMIKYRQLHLDSNHGFIRLDDDPPPVIQKPKNTPLSPLMTPNNRFKNQQAARRNTNVDRPLSELNSQAGAGPSSIPSGSSAGAARCAGGSRLPLKRNNDQPQINTSVADTNKVNKELGMSRGAVKKRPAPQPPLLLPQPCGFQLQPRESQHSPRVSQPPPDAKRDTAYYSALQRRQQEERRRKEQTAINIAQGLPPVLSPLEKLERLRKMDALHNRETSPPRAAPSRPHRPRAALQPEPVRNHSAQARDDLRNLKPMTPEEFMNRFNELQLQNDSGRSERGGGGDTAGPRTNGDRNGRIPGSDRFSEIKSSLRELRRGLNEVTAPYNSGPINSEPAVRRADPSSGSESEEEGEDVRLPCEFCDRLVPADDLVQHQTGCRPDLAQRRARSRPPARQGSGEPPVIPCEFCTESLPVYLIQAHQEMCRRDEYPLYPD